MVSKTDRRTLDRGASLRERLPVLVGTMPPAASCMLFVAASLDVDAPLAAWLAPAIPLEAIVVHAGALLGVAVFAWPCTPKGHAVYWPLLAVGASLYVVAAFGAGGSEAALQFVLLALGHLRRCVVGTGRPPHCLADRRAAAHADLRSRRRPAVDRGMAGRALATHRRSGVFRHAGGGRSDRAVSGNSTQRHGTGGVRAIATLRAQQHQPCGAGCGRHRWHRDSTWIDRGRGAVARSSMRCADDTGKIASRRTAME
jgi:hypothetical protein